MSIDLVADPRDRQRIEAAGFAKGLRELETSLRSRGYANATISFYGEASVHFALWASRRHITRPHVTNRHIESFVTRHLSRCTCPITGVRQVHTVRAALRQLKAVVGNEDRGADCEKARNAVEREVQSFDEHLCTTCGLQETTRTYRRRYVREFLQATVPDGRVDRLKLTPVGLVRYVSKRADRLKPGSAQVLASSLRSYLRFLQLRGLCTDRLILAVPAPAHWTLASLPKVLTDDQVNRWLAAFDRRTPTGRRDYAIARCVSDLGLRAGEVAALRLNDIDWRNGTLRLVGHKSRRDDDLPLPSTVAVAIVTYLREPRPDNAGRHVFLRIRPPIGSGVTRRIVCNVIRLAGVRAGMRDLIAGPRVLRHTAATRMLRHGASIKDIADVLRHRSLDTTAIYTKVDLPRLATVAAPWPQEGGR